MVKGRRFQVYYRDHRLRYCSLDRLKGLRVGIWACGIRARPSFPSHWNFDFMLTVDRAHSRADQLGLPISRELQAISTDPFSQGLEILACRTRTK